MAVDPEEEVPVPRPWVVLLVVDKLIVAEEVVCCFIFRLPSPPIIVPALFSLFSSSECCECVAGADVLELLCIGSGREVISLSIDTSAVSSAQGT